MRIPSRLELSMLACGIATFGLLYVTQPLLPALTTAFAVDEVEASLAVSTTTAALAVFLFGAGILSDRIGRRQVICMSLVAAASATLLASVAQTFPVLLAARILSGIALAGVPSVAIGFIGEEAGAAAAERAIGLYVAGTTMGGLAGRVGAGVIDSLFGWRAAIAAVGAWGLLLALLFVLAAPAGAGFVPRRRDLRDIVAATRRLLRDRQIGAALALAFLLMGGFVSLYNYAGFHLRDAPFSLSPAAASAVFLLYLAGTAGATAFTRSAGRRGPLAALIRPILCFAAGTALTLAPSLPLFILGLGGATAGFFGAHAVASALVSRRAGADRTHGASLYLLTYYAGSSLFGTASGLTWRTAGWPGVVASVLALIALGLLCVFLTLKGPADA